MNFEKVIGALLSEFNKGKIPFALIGGLALQLVGVDRKTHDIDFIVGLEDGGKIDAIMKSLGYERLHRTENVANYHGLSGLGQVDFLFAHRKYSLNMLKHAVQADLFGFKIRVARPEDLIGLKVQSSSNDPKRAAQDMMDIRNMLRANSKIDLDLVREYFQLFKREEELDEILQEKE